MSEVKGIVFNIQRYSIDDGPGIRSTVFLKGCPLRCQWCSNPESQNPRPEVAHRDSLCTRCNQCVEVCPNGAISLTQKGIQIDRNHCDNCAKCTAVCVPGALKVFGTEMSVGEVFEEVHRDAIYYQRSGGGVTVSGGEPLQQVDFVVELFRRCREAGIHTCLDTSGYATTEAFRRVLPHTDLVFFDMKHMDPMAHAHLTGRSNEPILTNLQLLVATGTSVIIRIPVIPGRNDSEDNILSMARAISQLGLKQAHLLPYHRFGLGKYQMLDRAYELTDLSPPRVEELQRIREVFDQHGIACQVRL